VTAETNGVVVRRVLAALDQGDWTMFDEHPGLHETRQHLPLFRAAFPDMRHTIETEFSAGEMIACVMNVRGTHHGVFMGISPTGKPMSIMLLWINRIVDGRIVEHWAVPDFLSLFQQLGATPTVATLGAEKPSV